MGESGRGSPGGDPLIGTSLGRYVLLERVGAGGMGTVYLALDPELERNVALKLLPWAPRGSKVRDRQLREAKVMAMLAHPNVAAVYDLGVNDDRIFIAMEFVDGWSLKGWLREERPWREVLDVFVQAARGLAAAHERGLIHRDFKPGNVMVGRDGRARVVDFGLARHKHRSQEHPVVLDEIEDEDTRETAVGTPAYMAPEQHLGRETDARSDQFSFCLALWEGLYGERPFTARNSDELAEQILEHRLRALPHDTEVPEVVHQVLERGLAADPARRFGSMHDLIEALQRSTGDATASRRPGRDLALPPRYRVLRPAVGLGRTFHGYDLETSRMVLLVLNERSEGDLPGLDSLRRLFGLSDPHLAPISDMGLDVEGQPFFALDLEGEVGSVLDHLAGRSRQRKLIALRSVLSGLAALHQAGLAHGCLGRRTVLSVGERILLAPIATVPSWTSLAPERLMGRPSGPAADLYAVGVLAFELFTGLPPYAGESWEEVTDLVLSRAPDYAAIEDADLEAFTRRLLAERPERRLRSATEALAQLADLLRSRPGTPARPLRSVSA